MTDLLRSFGRLSRRRFLALAGSGAAGFVVGGCGGRGRASGPTTSEPAGTTSEPSGTTSVPSRPTSTTRAVQTPTTSGPPDNAAWAGLAARLNGTLVLPSSAGYLTDLQLFDSRFDTVRPAAIAYCATPTDVQRCVGFATEHGVHLAARSGGHSYAGYSTTNGLVVDVTRMSAVTVSPGAAAIGAGARLIDVYSALNARGVSIPAGSCPTVGIAGLALGGGAGVVGRAHGLTCDALQGVELVTADARMVTADASTNADLFWACRGGGGGNFGIATGFTFATFPTPDVTVFFLTWPWAAAADVVAGFLGWAPGAPDALWSNLLLYTRPTTGGPQLQVGGVWLGSSAQAGPLLDQLVRMVGPGPASRTVEEVSFGHDMFVEAGCATLSQAACHLPTEATGGSLTRQPSLAKSDYLVAPLSDAGIQALLAGVDARSGQGAPGAAGIDSYGGAIGRVDPAATAFVHRDAIASIQYNADFTPGTSAPALAQAQTWLDGWYATMRPYVSGQAYQNYIDPGLADWPKAYYGANLPRLEQIKQTWDPDGVWAFAQSIRRA